MPALLLVQYEAKCFTVDLSYEMFVVIRHPINTYENELGIVRF